MEKGANQGPQEELAQMELEGNQESGVNQEPEVLMAPLGIKVHVESLDHLEDKVPGELQEKMDKLDLVGKLDQEGHQDRMVKEADQVYKGNLVHLDSKVPEVSQVHAVLMDSQANLVVREKEASVDQLVNQDLLEQEVKLVYQAKMERQDHVVHLELQVHQVFLGNRGQLGKLVNQETLVDLEKEGQMEHLGLEANQACKVQGENQEVRDSVVRMASVVLMVNQEQEEKMVKL